MKIRDCMTAHVVCVGAEEPAETAARLMARYNLGLLPVRGADGRMCGVVTDRDLVLRCMAAGQEAGKLPVARAMNSTTRRRHSGTRPRRSWMRMRMPGRARCWKARSGRNLRRNTVI